MRFEKERALVLAECVHALVEESAVERRRRRRSFPCISLEEWCREWEWEWCRGMHCAMAFSAVGWKAATMT
jgi:hypothetical protein